MSKARLNKIYKESYVRTVIKKCIAESAISTPPKHIKNSEVLFGKLMGYDVGKMIGSGAAGYVFEARVIETGEPVVIKFSKNENEWRSYIAARTARNLLPDDLAKHIVRIDHASNIKSIPAILEKYPDLKTNKFGESSVIVMEKLNPLGKDLKTYYFKPDLFFQTYEDVHEIFKKSLKDVYQDMQYDVTLDFLRKADRIKFLHEMMSTLAKNKNEIEKQMYERPKEKRRGPTDIPDLRRKDELFEQLSAWVSKTLKNVIEKWNCKDRTTAICMKISYKLLEEIMYNRQIIRRPSAEQKSVQSDEAVGLQFHELAKAIESLGFTYDDLHEENLLIRPGTDDLVFADVGQFTYKDS
jgi:serine/threonine protein kinase